MNTRVLALIKNPDLFQPDDLRILEIEISNTPYVQSFRALQLYGIHLFQPENYAAKLSETAAFTTDKKILYRLINKKPETTSIPQRTPSPEIAATKTTESKFMTVEPVAIPQPKPIYSNGELNRILFEGEEDFMNQHQEIIDLESTAESGVLTTQKTQPQPSEILPDKTKTTENNFAETADAEDFSKEIIINEDQIQHEKTEIENPADLSFEETSNVKIEVDAAIKDSETENNFPETPDAEDFSKEIIINESQMQQEKAPVENTADLNFHGMSDFMPEVKIAPSKHQSTPKPAPKPAVNRYEEEMQRLIAEVEAKMKVAKKSPEKVENEPVHNTEINFAQTESFIVEQPKHQTEWAAVRKTEPENPVLTAKTEPIQEPEKTEPIAAVDSAKIKDNATKEIATELKKPSVPDEKSAWQPMQIAANLPDSMIRQKEEKTVAINIKQPASETVENVAIQETKEERPAFNVSFFTQEVAPLETKKNEQKAPTEKTSEPETAQESNVPVFINTWQNWLKIDRSTTDEKPIVSKAEQKNKTIENFIEKEPKISKLKDDSDFVVKDKGDNIQHLMTETLARLYTEQKLYAKAIKAYEILGEKHPGKKSFFDDKIQEVKDLRQSKS